MEIAILLCGLLLLQCFFGFYQLHYLNRFIKKLNQKYNGKNNVQIISDQIKSRKASVIGVAVIQNDKIVEFNILSGFTVFSRFKLVSELSNIQLADLKKDIVQKNQKIAYIQLTEKIIKKFESGNKL